MRRKVLLSLLAAGAVPAGVYANVDLTSDIQAGGDWTINGLGSADFANALSLANLQTESVSVLTASTGNISIGVTKLPSGTYKLSYGIGENVKVEIKNATIVTSTTGSVEFTAKGDITIVVSSENNTEGFTFGEVNFELVFDFEGLQNQLNDELTDKALYLNDVDDDDTSDTAKELRSQKDELETQIAKVQADVAKLSNETIATYNELGLSSDPSTVETNVTNLIADIDKYNAAVEAEKTRYSNEVANKAALDAINQQLEELTGKINALKASVPDENIGSEYQNYPMEQISNGISSLEGAISELEKQAETTYDKDDEVVDPNQYDENITALKNQFDELQKEYNNAVEDAIAYTTIQGYLSELSNAYNPVYATVNGLRTSEYKTTRLKALDGIYNTAKAALEDIEIPEASEKLQDATATKDDAITAMQGLQDSIEAKVEAVEEANKSYTDTENGTIPGFQSQLDALKKSIELVKNTDLKSSLTEQADAIQKLIDTLGTNVSEAYNDYTLTEKAFSSEITEISTSLDSLKSSLVVVNNYLANLAVIDGYQKALDSAKTAINNNTPTAYPGQIVGKFSESYDNIQDAINDLTTLVEDAFSENKEYTIAEAQTTYINDGITNYKTLGVQAATALKEKVTQYTNALTAWNNYNSYTLTPLEGNEVKKENLDKYEEAIKAFKDSIDNCVANETANSFWEKITNLSLDCTDSVVKAQALAYAKEFVGENLSILREKVDGYQALVDAEDASEVYGPGLAAIKTKVNTYEDTYSKLFTAFNNAKTTDALKNVNEVTKIRNIIKAYTDAAVDEAIEKALDNVAAKKALDEKYADLYGLCNGLEGWVTANSTQPATAAWLVSEAYKNLSTSLEALNEAIGAKYDENALKTSLDANADVNGSYMAQLNDWNKAYEAFKVKVTANETAHNQMLEVSEATTGKVNEALSAIEEANFALDAEVEYDGETYTIDELKGMLNALLAEEPEEGNIEYVNVEVYDDFRALASVDKSAERTEEYEAIQDKVDAILSAIGSDYYNSVVEQNKAAVEEWITPAINDVDRAYKQAVDDYNLYSTTDGSGDSDSDYLKALNSEADGFVNHEWVYQYAEQIKQLKADLEKLVKSATPALNENGFGDYNEENTGEILTKASFQNLQSTASELKEAISAKDAEVVEAANDFAEEYYQSALEAANQKVKDAQDQLVSIAGMSEADAQAETAEAADSIAAAVSERETITDNLSLNIGTVLPKLNVTVDFNKASKNYWDRQYRNVNITIFELTASLDEEQVPKQIETINTALEGIEVLNSQAGSFYEEDCLFDNVRDLVSELNFQLYLIKTAAKRATQIMEENAAKKAQYEAYQKQLEDLWSDYNAMVEAVGSLDLYLEDFQTINTPAAQKAVQAFSDALEGFYSDDTVNYGFLYDNAVAAIEDCYKAAYDLYYSMLSSQYDQVVLDYNNYRADNTVEGVISDEVTENLNAWQTKIDAAKALLDEQDEFNKEDPAQQLADLQTVETALNDIQTEIGKTEPVENKTQEAISKANAAFEEAKTAAENALEALNAAMDNSDEGIKAYLATTYGTAVADLTAEISAIADNYEKAGNNVVLTYQEFVSQMEGVTEQVNAKTEAVAQSAEACQESNAAAGTIEGNFETLSAKIGEAKTLVEGYAKTIEDFNQDPDVDYMSTLNMMEEDLQVMQGAVEEAKANYTLTSSTYADEYEDTVNEYMEALGQIEANSTMEITTKLVNMAGDELLAAKNILVGDIANKAALLDRLQELEDAYALLEPTTDVDAGAEVIAAAQDVIANAKALAADVKDNTVEVGDITGDDDVNIGDYRALLKMILNEAKYDSTDKTSVAADTNRDGKINVADLTALINLISGEDASKVSVMARCPEKKGSNTATLRLIGEESNVRRVAVILDNVNEFVNLQLDINVPDGMEIVAEGLDSRAAGLELYSNDLEDGRHRVVLASSELTAIEGNGGAILYFDIAGSSSGNVTISNGTASDRRGAAYSIESEEQGVSGVSTFGEYVKAGLDKIYDLGGRALTKIQKGLNIIRNADGTSSKVIKK